MRRREGRAEVALVQVGYASLDDDNDDDDGGGGGGDDDDSESVRSVILE